MAWIRTISEDEATGDLERQYKAAVKRAGKVFQIVKLQSLRPLSGWVIQSLLYSTAPG